MELWLIPTFCLGAIALILVGAQLERHANKHRNHKGG
jgi:hypothetical protein